MVAPVNAPPPTQPIEIDAWLDSVAITVAKYFDENPDEYVAEVVVPREIDEDELEEYLPWLSDLISEQGLEDHCAVSYNADEREIRVERN